MKFDIAARLYFDGKEMGPGTFLPILQQGFMAETKIGISVQELLADQFGLSSTYVEDRISTVFLDGKPIDDFENTIVRQGSTLALSAAMPGLVGATFRKGGGLAVFRSSITHDGTVSSIETGTGFITIKLFNLLVKEIGTLFLNKGIYIDTETANSFFLRQPEHFWMSCKNAQIERVDSSPELLGIVNWLELRGLIFLCLE